MQPQTWASGNRYQAAGIRLQERFGEARCFAERPPGAHGGQDFSNTVALNALATEQERGKKVTFPVGPEACDLKPEAFFTVIETLSKLRGSVTSSSPSRNTVPL